jgi:Cof subfamily protein (haloacid dehalogenase superfamily)
MKRIRAVFCDIDHTLTIPYTRTIPESAKRALAQARENGVLVFVATGRNLTAFEVKFLDGLVFDGYVTVNGQLCYLPNGTILRKASFDPQDVQLCLELGDRYGFHANCHEQFATYLSGVDDGVSAFYEFVNGKMPEIRPLSAFGFSEILSIVPFVGQEMDEFFRKKLPGCQVLRWNPYSCDIAPRSGGKDVGIQAMLDHFGLKMKDCLAIGDGGNDVSMIRAAGLGVAVGGAREETKQAADYIAPEVEDDAIEHVFRKFGLIS